MTFDFYLHVLGFMSIFIALPIFTINLIAGGLVFVGGWVLFFSPLIIHRYRKGEVSEQ